MALELEKKFFEFAMNNLTFQDFIGILFIAAVVIYALRWIGGYIYYWIMQKDDKDDFHDGNNFKLS
jgi:NhaP-type Na+/H+ or K+/H+ antiporter